MSDEKKEPKRSANAKPKKGGKPKSGGKGKGEPKKLGFPEHLLISTEYLTWKKSAWDLSNDLKPYGLSISTLGKAIASYSLNKCSHGFDKKLVSQYAEYEKLFRAWESLRDSFRSSSDSTTIPVGVAQTLLAL